MPDYMRVVGDLGQRFEVRVRQEGQWTAVAWTDTERLAEQLRVQAEADSGYEAVVIDRQIKLPLQS
jgi:hypothetical protein